MEKRGEGEQVKDDVDATVSSYFGDKATSPFGLKAPGLAQQDQVIYHHKATDDVRQARSQS